VAAVGAGKIRYRFIDTIGRDRGFMNCRTFVAGDDFRGSLTGPRGALAIAENYQRQGASGTGGPTIEKCPCQALSGNVTYAAGPVTTLPAEKPNLAPLVAHDRGPLGYTH
jgi:hypothetical protein